MADISIQFHAAPEELSLFARAFAIDFRLFLTAMRFFPFQAGEVRPGDLDELIAVPSSAYSRFAFTVNKPALPASNELTFSDKNPGYLRLDVGKRTTKGLEQSWLSCRTSDRQELEVWKNAAKRIRKFTKTGVLAVNPTTGASALMKDFRYSEGARAMQNQGIAMLPPAGNAILKIL